MAEQENKVGHSRTIIAGDFNMNPFEFGLAGAPGFNAAMTPTLARRGTRLVESRPHRYFYNPMWNHFGDRGPNPPGTYFHENSTLRWNMFDQVLVRPDLIGKFMDGAVSPTPIWRRTTCPWPRRLRENGDMQENEVDLWPADLAQEDANSPVAILRQQAEALAAHTGHKLRARVATQPDGSVELRGSS